MTNLTPEERERPVRSFAELRTTGLLWLINRVVFHPRGFALAIDYGDATLDEIDAGAPATGWQLLGNGAESWTMAISPEQEDELFCLAETFLNAHRSSKT